LEPSAGVRFAPDSQLEEAGFELSVPQKTSGVPSRLRFPFAADYFSLPGNQAEATSGVLRTLVVSRETESVEAGFLRLASLLETKLHSSRSIGQVARQWAEN
jgi:hypothetical protein